MEKIKIDKEKCKGCMLCVNVCPKKILTVSEDVNEKGIQYIFVKNIDECIKCGLCAIMCPDCAIEFLEEKNE